MGKAIGRFLILASGDERTYRCLHPYSHSNLLPYSQAARPPYCSPPAREYASPPAANWRRDTDRWWRQLTRLPRPFPQYPPLTLRYGTMRLLCCASGAACAGQWPWVPARTFDVIVLTEQRYALTPSLHLCPAGSPCVQSHAAAKSYLHTDYERELVPLFIKVQKNGAFRK